MLEDFFIVPAAAQRLRSCALGVHLDGFCTQLADLGYRRATIRHKLWVVTSLARWMAGKHVAVVDLDEQRVEKFLSARRRRGRTCRGFRGTMLLLLERLRSTGVVPTPTPVCDDSPMAALLARYEGHLRRERALAETTIAGYLPFVRACVTECLDGGAARPDSLRPADVRGFLLTRVHRMVPKRAQFMASALRSFLRFLFLRGEIGTDLSHTVPTVRQWPVERLARRRHAVADKPRCAMSTIREALETYLALRRGLGTELVRPGAYLNRFVEFLDHEGASVVTTALAVRWATTPADTTPATKASRLDDVRRFAVWLSATDPRTEIPPRGLLPDRYRRRPPYIYSDQEIERIVREAAQLRSVSGLRAQTYADLRHALRPARRDRPAPERSAHPRP